MPLTQLDDKCALIVIDLQKGIVSADTAHPSSQIVERAARLAQAFRQKHRPVFLVNVTGGAPGRTDAGPSNLARPSDWAELVPELDHQPSDHLISKQRWGAFLGTSLDKDLRALGVTQIVLVGISTSIGVESTARSAYDLGYNVVVVVDAVTDRVAAAHDNSVTKIFPRLGETAFTQEVLRVLQESR